MGSKLLPFLVSIPHSGEAIPPEASWLKALPEKTVMCDVDRFVDKMYQPALTQHNIPSVVAKWHRYSGDLNRLPEDVDASTVVGHAHPPGKFSRGFLWSITTTGEKLMPEPISQEAFQILVSKYFQPFHDELKKQSQQLMDKGVVYHLDAHSMPSVGTKEHRDPGERRADFVISDQNGKSCRPEFLEIVVQAYRQQGYQVKINWPYIGGRITEMYGRPQQGHHTLQVEMNRALYMDENTKQFLPTQAAVVQKALTQALGEIKAGLRDLVYS